MRKLVALLPLLLLCMVTAIGQSRTVTGKVLDENGQPVEGASVRIKGSNAGTSADAKGEFTIAVAPGEVLVISALNFATIERKAGDGPLVIKLAKADAQLSEVVVTTALGIKRTRSSLPYSTQQISSEELNKIPSTNVLNNMSGKIAGLQVTTSNSLGGSNNVILRGMKSISKSNQALFVIDGVPFDNSDQTRNGFDLGTAAQDLNPEDIESINVLKGAAASALYGSRAANGVIVINTKKGVRGKRGLGVTLNLGAQVGTPDKSTLPTYQTEYGEGYGSAGGSPVAGGGFYYQPVFNSSGQNVNIVMTDADAATGPAYDPSLMVYNWDAFSPTNKNYGKATPWVAAAHHNPTDFFRTPVTTTASLFVEGGGDRGTFKMGYTNGYDRGLLPNSEIKKNQLNFGATYDVTDKITLGGTFNYSSTNGVGLNGYTYAAGGPMTDFRQWWPTNVDILAQKQDYFNSLTNATWNWSGGYASNAPGNLASPAYHNNLYWQAYQNYNNDTKNRYFGNVNLNYKITSYLNLMGRVSMDRWDQMFENRNNIGSVGTSMYERYNASRAETNYDLILNFDKNITRDINLKALLGGNIRQEDLQTIDASTNGGLVVPGFYALANSVNTPAAPAETHTKREVDGVFAGATIGYKEMITLDGTIRRDKSSTLPAGNNAYYYPAVSANFVFSKLLSNWKWLSYGKIRANYASVGNDADVAKIYNVYDPGTTFHAQPIFTVDRSNNNLNLKPESNRNYEFGMEASFLHNRIGFDVTYYHSRQTNQTQYISPSLASGFYQYYVNGGTVQNQGWEVTLNATPVRTRDFSWNVAVNWSRNRNKVLSLYNNQPSYTIASLQNSIQLVAEVGKPYGIIRGTDYKYLNGQRLIDADGNPVLADNPKSDIGNTNPDWMGGINNSFRYKNIALSFLIDVRHGGDVYSLDMDYGSYSGLYPETAGKNANGKSVRAPLSEGGGYLFTGVTADGKPNTKLVDASDFNNGAWPFSSAGEVMAAKSYVYDGSYVKLREVAITYSLPKKAVDKLGFVKGIDFSLTGRNLWIIHKNLPYADPEQGQASGNASIGYQNGAYPSVRTFGANLKLKF